MQRLNWLLLGAAVAAGGSTVVILGGGEAAKKASANDAPRVAVSGPGHREEPLAPDVLQDAKPDSRAPAATDDDDRRPRGVAYPRIGDRLAVDGRPLNEVDLEQLDLEQLERLHSDSRRLAKELEAEFLETQVDWRSRLLSRDEAEARLERGVAGYLVCVDLGRYGPGRGTEYYELPGPPPPELAELASLSLQVTSSPTYREGRFAELREWLGPEESGRIAHWTEDWGGARLIGHDAAGNAITQLRLRPVGTP